MQVHKFGGTCLATAQRIQEAASHIVEILRDSNDQQMVVVSAMGSHISSPVKVSMASDFLLELSDCKLLFL